MNTQDFDKQLQTLSFLSGSYESVDSFTTEYERILEEVKTINDKNLRKARAGALKGVLSRVADKYSIQVGSKCPG